jgi:hypothetical protein
LDSGKGNGSNAVDDSIRPQSFIGNHQTSVANGTADLACRNTGMSHTDTGVPVSPSTVIKAQSGSTAESAERPPGRPSSLIE